jgi:hypothetical protein
MTIPFAHKVYGLQVSIVRELNDAHIFLEQSQPLLVEARNEIEASTSKAKGAITCRSWGGRSSRSEPTHN